jgi:ribose transport system substrate-binding protein
MISHSRRSFTRVAKRSILQISAVAAACGLVAACSPSKDKTAADTTSGDKKPFVIAMIAKSSTNPVFQASLIGAQQAAKEQSEKLGREVRIAWLTPPEIDGQGQAQRIAQAVNEGASALLVACADAGKVTGAIDDAVARGVPVMLFDSDAPNSKRFSIYGTDDTLAGQRTMDELATLMGGKGKIGILAGNQNAPNLQLRVKGVKDAAKKYPGITVVNTFYHVETPQDAAAEVVRAMNAYPEMTGWAFIGGWPLFGRGLMTAVDPAKVKIVSIDALPPELPYVEKGIVPVLLAQPVYQWGYVSVNTIIDHVIHKKEVPEYIPMPLVRVTKDNLGTWARQLQEWKFTGIDSAYLARPN